ncbi:MAG TPA: CoA transferase [Gammaproteobacteria bacterium]|nr:CoA transferase [Gammaproteobacteria bacterium]HIK68494.1 CoA transferase [Pseudomonadales bacterium]
MQKKPTEKQALKPLTGYSVLDFSAVFAGPICTRFLSDCGATVIKIEPPNGGDVIRGPKGNSRIFAHFNAGKQSVAINLNDPEGQELARTLAQDADIVIENYRPGVMKKFGLDYASLTENRDDLVYCSISGFGQSGPFVHHAAYAPIAHAASGFDAAFAKVQPEPDQPPPIWSIMIADMLTGAYAFGAIQTALLGREKTGRGDYIDVTMMESMMMLIPGQIQNAQLENPPAGAGFHPIQVKDGFVMICIVSAKNLRCLCEAIERPDMLVDQRYQLGERAKNISSFIDQIEAWSKPLSATECEHRLNQHEVPCSIYNSPADLFSHPQLIERESFTAFSDKTSNFLIQNPPFKLASVDISTSNSAPTLGQQTHAILAKNLDLPEQKLAALASRKVIN